MCLRLMLQLIWEAPSRFGPNMSKCLNLETTQTNIWQAEDLEMNHYKYKPQSQAMRSIHSVGISPQYLTMN